MSKLHESNMKILELALTIDEAAKNTIAGTEILLLLPNFDTMSDDNWRQALKTTLGVIKLQRDFIKNQIEHQSQIFDLIEQFANKTI